MEKRLLDAYFAGLIDGEGCVDVYNYKQGTLKRPVVKVDMTCEITVRRLHNYFGGYCSIKKTRAGTKPQWRWEVTFQNAVRVCKQLAPYLVTKAEGAKRVMQYKPARPRGRPRKTA